MTQQQRLIQIAEACGIERRKAVNANRWAWFKGHERLCDWVNEINDNNIEGLPDFDSLDSMREAVLMQDEEFQIWFAWFLETKTIPLTSNKYPNLRANNFHQLTVLDWQVSFVKTLEQLKRV